MASSLVQDPAVGEACRDAVAAARAEEAACARVLRLVTRQQAAMARRDPARLARASAACQAALVRLEACVVGRQEALGRLCAAAGIASGDFGLKFVSRVDDNHGEGLENALAALAATSQRLRDRNRQSHELASRSLSLVREELALLCGAGGQDAYDGRGTEAPPSRGVVDGRA